MAAARLERDASLATALESSGIHAFAQSWYEQPMWSSLKQHPRCVTGISSSLVLTVGLHVAAAWTFVV